MIPFDGGKKLTYNQAIVADFFEVMSQKPSGNALYIERARRIASMLGKDGFPSTDVPLATSLPTSIEKRSSASDAVRRSIGVEGLDAIAKLNVACAMRSSIVDVIDASRIFSRRATIAGYIVPANPYFEILNLGDMSSTDRLLVTPEKSDDIVSRIFTYVDLMAREDAGTIDLDSTQLTAAQISSFSISLDGFGGSGNDSLDIMKLLPDADALRSSRAQESLSKLSFKRRKVEVVFTSDFVVDGELRGSIVGWRRVTDAVGYIVTRKNIFTGEERVFTLDNEGLDEAFDSFFDYVLKWVAGFYSGIDMGSLYFFVDGTIERDSYYSYTVKGYRNVKRSSDSIFSTPTTAKSMSLQSRVYVNRDLQELQATISPWPIISFQLLGDRSFDWILAGVNVRASIDRGDPRSVTRRLSYTSATMGFLFAQMDVGLFVVPNDVNEVVKNVKQSLSQFGPMSTITEILDETGTLYYFDGTDMIGDPDFKSIDRPTADTSAIVSAVADAIDPSTATINLKSLASNLPRVLSAGGFFSSKEELGIGGISNVADTSKEVNVGMKPKESDDVVQFIGEKSQVNNDRADLTTFDGISKTMESIRIISDAESNPRFQARKEEGE